MIYIIIGLTSVLIYIVKNLVIRRIWVFIIIHKLDKIHLDTCPCENDKIIKTAALDGAQDTLLHSKLSPRRSSGIGHWHNGIFCDTEKHCYYLRELILCVCVCVWKRERERNEGSKVFLLCVIVSLFYHWAWAFHTYNYCMCHLSSDILELWFWERLFDCSVGPQISQPCLIGKDPNAGKDLGQEEKGTTEDKMAGWHHQHDGHGFG